MGTTDNLNGFVSRTYRCIGGPYDGESKQLPAGRNGFAVHVLADERPSAEPGAIRARSAVTTGRYTMERHPTLGYALVWCAAPSAPSR